MVMPGRKYTAPNGNYRFGFNGKENDNDVKGEGNQQDYGMRIYDPRLGRFLSVDPLTEDYPWLTPYQFASNSPIAFVDQDGEELAYRLPDGKTYIPQGDNLRLPIPNNATLIPGQVQKNNVNLQGISTTLDLIPGIGTFKGAVEGVVGYDMAGNRLSTTDRVLGVVPYVKTLKKVKTINNLVKATDKVDEVKDVTKAANKIDDVKTTEKALVKNKNANDAEGDFMLYDVHADGPKQGKILKVGKANEAKKRADGTVDRLAVSQRKVRKEGYPNATATPRKSLGRTTTKKATDAEAAEVVKERAQGNDLPLNKERAKKYKGGN
jgi:RHS repeat-associated protein